MVLQAKNIEFTAECPFLSFEKSMPYRCICQTVSRVRTPEDFPEKTQNTSYIERFNLTLRQGISYLHRKTLGYCKSKPHLETSLWIKLFDYNYCRFHKGLRIVLSQESGKFQQKYQHVTPAMRMGLTKGSLNWGYLFSLPVSDKYLK